MAGRVEGKVALVTGGASGIGRATALALVREGARVVISDRDADRGRGVEAELGGAGRFMEQDVTDEAAWVVLVDTVVSEFGGLDVLVNNAGVGGGRVPITDVSLEQWRRVNAVNLEGVFLGTREGVRVMRERGGSIVNISSILGLVGQAQAAAYSASKGGVRLLTKSVAYECGEAGWPVRVNSVHPGYIETPLTQPILNEGDTRAGLRRLHPIGRLGRDEDVANTVLFLASDESAFVTGAEMVVDGGYTAR